MRPDRFTLNPSRQSPSRVPLVSTHVSSSYHETEELRGRLLAAIDALPYESAVALWLVDVCQCSYRDAASITNISLHQFTNNLHATRRHLVSVVKP